MSREHCNRKQQSTAVQVCKSSMESIKQPTRTTPAESKLAQSYYASNIVSLKKHNMQSKSTVVTKSGAQSRADGKQDSSFQMAYHRLQTLHPCCIDMRRSTKVQNCNCADLHTLQFCKVADFSSSESRRTADVQVRTDPHRYRMHNTLSLLVHIEIYRSSVSDKF